MFYVSADTSGCAYTYEEQPLTNLECNPYPNNRLILSCAVRGPNLVSIDWFWEPLNTRQPQRLPSTQNKYSLVTQFSVSQSRSQLRVQQLNDNDAGWYYCQGNLSNGTLLILSNRLFLAVQSEYTGALNATTCPVETQSTREPTCASIASSTATPNSIADGERGSTDSTTSLPTFLLTTTITLTPTPTMTTVPNSESSRLWVVLYSMAAMIVVFCAIIVTLGFTTVIVYRKKPGDTTPKKTAGKPSLTHSIKLYMLSPHSILNVYLHCFLPKLYTCNSPMVPPYVSVFFYLQIRSLELTLSTQMPPGIG